MNIEHRKQVEHHNKLQAHMRQMLAEIPDLTIAIAAERVEWLGYFGTTEQGPWLHYTIMVVRALKDECVHWEDNAFSVSTLAKAFFDPSTLEHDAIIVFWASKRCGSMLAAHINSHLYHNSAPSLTMRIEASQAIRRDARWMAKEKHMRMFNDPKVWPFIERMRRESTEDDQCT